MITESRFEQAFRSSDRIAALRKLAQQLLDEGLNLAMIQSEFERVRQELRSAGREEEEDAILDVMDFLTGWCSPHMKLDGQGGSIVERS